MTTLENDDAELRAVAQRLGARAESRLDVEATAQRVLQALREQPVSRPRWVPAPWLRIAAAIVLVLGGALVMREVWPGSTSTDHATHLVADDLRDLSADELRDVLASFDDVMEQGSPTTPNGDAGFEQLDAQQLRAVLRSLEG